jgi:hypothetical protein
VNRLPDIWLEEEFYPFPHTGDPTTYWVRSHYGSKVLKFHNFGGVKYWGILDWCVHTENFANFDVFDVSARSLQRYIIIKVGFHIHPCQR